MPDFVGLRAAAEEAVRQPEFATVAHRAAHLRRRHHMTTGAGAAALAVAIVAGGQLFAGTTITPAGPDASATPLPANAVVMDAAAGDATHLYALVTTEPCGVPPCDRLLRASEDGGRTWQARMMPLDDPGISWGGLDAVGPRTLVLQGSRFRTADGSALPPLPSPSAQPANQAVPPHVSLDGGVTWRPVNKVDTPVPAVPEGGILVDPIRMRIDTDAAMVFDPATARIAPLANQPQMTVRKAPPRAGTGLWLSGWDPTSRKPAVSVSHDRGLTWTIKVFTDGAVPADPNFGFAPSLTIGGGGATAYAWFYNNGAQIRRTTDGGASWTTMPPPDLQGISPSLAFVAADGAYVAAVVDNMVRVTYVASRNGQPFQPVTLSGLPSPAGQIATASDGTYFVDNTGTDIVRTYEALYISNDGWTYRTVAIG